MKRTCKPKFESLVSIFPLFFWLLCSKCKLEFRREWGWSAIVGPRDVRYLCCKCVTIREDADRYFLNNEWLPSCPERPPPPPSIELVRPSCDVILKEPYIRD